MNNNENGNSGVMPYKASGNMNTSIGNPNMNVNDIMDVNIQNMATNSKQYTNTVNVNNIQGNNSNSSVSNNNVVNNYVNNQMSSQNTSSNNVNRTYVTIDNKPKKKNNQFNLGSEFKIALLIILILLIFVFMLPVISDMLGGY